MGGMRGWTELCSDVNWEDYHGMWARKGPDGAWYVLQWTNMVDACGDEAADLPYECQVKRLHLSELPEEERASALRSCGCDDRYEDPEHWELITLEACISYGLGAPLESFTGKVRPRNVRAEARRFAETCMRDADVLDRQLDRPVNALGSTAREYGLGDVQSAMLRGDSTTHQIMRKMHGIPEEHRVTFGTLQEDGALVNVRQIRQSDMLRCPHAIMMPDHYREDGSCKCNDPEHRAMMIREWGYAETDFSGGTIDE